MSKPLKKTQAWAEVYERRQAEGHESWGSTKQYEDKKARLESAIQRYALPLGAQWLELGCGAGNMTTWLIEHGYWGTGIDVVPGMSILDRGKNTHYIGSEWAGQLVVSDRRWPAGGQYSRIKATPCI